MQMEAKENAISRFVAKHFPPSPTGVIPEGGLVFGLEIMKKIQAGGLLVLLAEMAGATAWSGGPEGPTKEEIEVRVKKTGEILARHGLADVDPGKFFAAAVILSKFLMTGK
jgi:hypothetical protein